VGNTVGNGFLSQKKGFQQTAESLDSLCGDPSGVRTRVTGVRGLRYHPVNVETQGFSLHEIHADTKNTPRFVSAFVSAKIIPCSFIFSIPPHLINRVFFTTLSGPTSNHIFHRHLFVIFPTRQNLKPSQSVLVSSKMSDPMSKNSNFFSCWKLYHGFLNPDFVNLLYQTFYKLNLSRTTKKPQTARVMAENYSMSLTQAVTAEKTRLIRKPKHGRRKLSRTVDWGEAWKMMSMRAFSMTTRLLT
jgi:hypothetical protein